jgi:hypothetical protein
MAVRWILRPVAEVESLSPSAIAFRMQAMVTSHGFPGVRNNPAAMREAKCKQTGSSGPMSYRARASRREVRFVQVTVPKSGGLGPRTIENATKTARAVVSLSPLLPVEGAQPARFDSSSGR